MHAPKPMRSQRPNDQDDREIDPAMDPKRQHLIARLQIRIFFKTQTTKRISLTIRLI